MSAWISEETQALRDDVYEVLPYLLQLVVNARTPDQLQLLLPGLCHLSSEDFGRDLMIVPEIFTPLINRFREDFLSCYILDLSYGTAVLHTAGVFLNLVVLSPPDTCALPTFRLFFDSLLGVCPRLVWVSGMLASDTLILAHVVVLVLMLSSRAPQNQISIDTVPAIVSFLQFGMTHLFLCSPPPETEENYDELRGLWCLALQAFVPNHAVILMSARVPLFLVTCQNWCTDALHLNDDIFSGHDKLALISDMRQITTISRLS